MSISRRFLNLARSELNSLLDKAARWGDDDQGGEEAVGRPAPGDAAVAPQRKRRRSAPDGDLEAFSEAEMEAELERRRLERG